MFVYSAKMDKRKLLAILICLAVVVLVLVLAFTRGGGQSTEPQTADELRQSQIKLIKSARLKTNEDRLELLTSLGWEVGITPLECCEVTIPSEFSDVYANYNNLQKEQGLDLAQYKGETVTRYTYRVTNHPSGEDSVRATLLVRKDRLIAGDVSSPKLDGFMQTLVGMTDASTSGLAEGASTTAAEDAAATSAAEDAAATSAAAEAAVPDDAYPTD